MHKLVALKDFYLDQNTIPLTLISHHSSIFVVPSIAPPFFSSCFF